MKPVSPAVALAAALVLLPSCAFALDPQAALLDLRASLEANGYSLEAEIEERGEDRILRNVVVVNARDGSSVSFPGMTLRTRPYGAVAVDLDLSGEIVVVRDATIALEHASGTLEILARRDLEETVWTARAETLSFGIVRYAYEDWTRVHEVPVSGFLRLSDLAFSSRGEGGSAAGIFTLGALNTGATLSLRSSGEETIDASIVDLEARFSGSGDVRETQGRHGLVTLDVRSAREGGMRLEAESGTAMMAEDENGLRQESDMKDIRVVIDGLVGDTPLGLTIPRSMIALALAYGEGRSVTGSVGLVVEGALVDAQTWAIVDPQTSLAEEPFDLDMRVRIEGAVAEEGRDARSMPLEEALFAIEPETFAIERFRLGMFGMGIDVSGALNLEPLAGRFVVGLRDIGAALGAMVRASVLTEAEATQTRMMLPMFFTPAGEDDWTGTIEIDETGARMNGMPLPFP